ncbi:hypothetical protein BHF68_11535 [Desulfuribacillus alkaliarsenatis]|uniref:histidine kinase n=2 Tax=Desulfuribacillus alkaliarsenatis TaxID=766136 RepID=A0A1E5FYZ2_9FIRM|nr:hypothetical protein BHF68_11535 [Desulfuribacillus alkaliarsenatis]
MKDIRELSEKNIIKLARKSVTQDMDMGFVVMNKEYKVIEINDKAAYYYGLTREQILNVQNGKILNGFPREYLFCKCTLETGIPLKNHVVSWKVGDQKRSFVVDTILIKSRNKQIVGACSLIKDITALKSLELQIQHNERLAMIGQMAAGAAHEIRNPITSVRGFVQLLRRTLQQHEMNKEVGYTDIMLSEIDRITDLINEFLLLSKPREMKVVSCGLNDIIENVKPVISSESLLHDVEVTYELQVNALIRVDRDLLKQVFLNITRNAIEAMANDKGKLHISSTIFEKERMVAINFKDSGPGIPAYMVDKIFDPFFTTKDTGTGLGLPVCQRIVSELGGKIKVVSKGYGTTFSVYLPIEAIEG